MNFDRLNALLKERGLSRAFIAKKLGRSHALFTDWKNGKSKPSEIQITAIAELLGTTSEYLTGKTDKKNKPTDELDELKNV